VQVSPHFTLAELCRSEAAESRGLDNTPDAEQIKALGLLCSQVLERIRGHLKQPITVSSGYRGPAVNAAVGGSADSQHSLGEAADITVAGFSPAELFDWLVFVSGIDFDQAIYEFGRWVHVSHTGRRANRRQALEARTVDGATRYLPVTAPLGAARSVV
jgi:zinc D-Ala-D-Ala carboxypeptidase